MAESKRSLVTLPVPITIRGLSWPFLLLWSASFIVVLLILLPIVYLVLRALGNSSDVFATLSQARIWQIILNSLALALASALTAIMIGLPLAWLVVRSDLPLRRFWNTLAPLPLVLPSFVAAYLYISVLGPRGMLQQLLEGPFQITRLPSIYGFWGALFTLSMLTFPYVFLSARAALVRINPALEEAGRSLGLGPWQTFWRITLPQLRPALGSAALLVALYSLRDFGAVALMRYTTFTRAIYTQYSSFDRSQAAFLALLLIAMTIVVISLEARLFPRTREVAALQATLRQSAPVRLGLWRWPAFAFCSLIIGLSLFLPISVLAYWLVRGLLAGEMLATMGSAIRGSLLASAGGALFCLLAALPVSILVVRWPSRWSKLLERLIYIGFALPGIAIALALVFFGIQYARPLYQSFAMLMIAYTILFLPQAVGALRSALLQIHISLEESARSLGSSPLGVFWRVTLPLMRPGLVVAASLTFLTAMKELPITLLLAPTGFRTLATIVWSSVSEAYFARAAAPALLIVLLSSLPLALLNRNEQSS
jgi:iron(III) transport system permease protein